MQINCYFYNKIRPLCSKIFEYIKKSSIFASKMEMNESEKVVGYIVDYRSNGSLRL